MTLAPALYMQGSAAIDGVPIFRALDLHVAAGQWTCLLGSSGVGKSTVLKLFARLAEHVEFNGEFGAEGGDLTGRVALMAQSDLLLPWLSVSENVALGARLRGDAPDKSKVSHVLDRVGLADKAARRPGELSGGQRQRVALARTLMEDRPVVLLDEPFSALDAKNRSLMQELTAEVLQDRTVLLVTHDPVEAARLGHAINLMTDRGIETVTPPPGTVPRAVDDEIVLKVQAALLARLRED
ncbi:ABC transporter ATP-binding protein [Cognatishimia maritima]|uniref:Putative hydroxymethylpyrimidine transport system ATP-binding protein n=1 Tax=Cognatishimia maritima TaxID=870908 RepID=A0A1M5MWZ2_9RHOB|nr:ABC transporter ATP-binding protein [Cognatishimia maritima]SHG81818.1 putative hydroxymethylpyrimidine transport system ATP-binding protein [Cognatishimia maritima]